MRKVLSVLIIVVFLLCLGFFFWQDFHQLPPVDAPQEEPPAGHCLPEDAPEPQLPGGADRLPSSQTTDLPPQAIGALCSQLFMPVENFAPPNEELQVYQPKQVRIEDNVLCFTAERDADNGYRSGQVASVVGFQYGSITLRLHSMEDPGLFPAVWMLPVGDSLLPEVDIFEQIGRENDAFYGVSHYQVLEPGAAPSRDREFFRYVFPGEVPEHYTLRFDWTPEQMTWTLDDQVIATITEAVPQEPMYLLMNLAVGGVWCGDPTEETHFPADFTVEILEFQPENVYTR